MKEPTARTQHIRYLIATQQCDNAWYLKVASMLRVDYEHLIKEGWHQHYWSKEWGTISLEESEGRHVVVWVRPDLKSPIAAFEEANNNIAIIKFALMAELIKEIKQSGLVTYAEVGFPIEWRSCRIFLNGLEVDQVIKADSILGFCDVYEKDKNGKVKVDGKEYVVKTIKGVVDIKVDQKTQAFF